MPAPVSPAGVPPAPEAVAPFAPASGPIAAGPALSPEEISRDDRRDRERDREAGAPAEGAVIPEEAYPADDAYDPDSGTTGDGAYQNGQYTDDGGYDDEAPYGDQPPPYGEENPYDGDNPDPDGDGYDQYGAQRRRTRRRLLQEIPKACGDIGTLTTWQSGGVFVISPVAPEPPRRQPGVKALLDATRPLGDKIAVVGKLGAPKNLPDKFRNPAEYNPLHVCSWRSVLCGPDGPVQIIAIGGEGLLPAQLLSGVPSLRGIAVFGSHTQDGSGEPLPDIPPKSEVRTCVRGRRAPSIWRDTGRVLMVVHVFGLVWHPGFCRRLCCTGVSVM